MRRGPKPSQFGERYYPLQSQEYTPPLNARLTNEAWPVFQYVRCYHPLVELSWWLLLRITSASSSASGPVEGPDADRGFFCTYSRKATDGGLRGTFSHRAL